MVNEDARIDTNDPYYIHPSDHPGMILVMPPFDGKNFGEWRRSIWIALSAKNKAGFVNGEILKPAATSLKLKNWQRCNDMVISWIINSLSSDIRRSVIYTDTARGIWTELESRFGKLGATQLYSIQKELSRLEQDIHQTYSLLVEDENQRETKPGSNSNLFEGASMHAKTQSSSRFGGVTASSSRSGNFASSGGNSTDSTKGGGDRKPLFCTNCKKSNHTVERCFFLIGFPPGYREGKDKGSVQTSGKENKKPGGDGKFAGSSVQSSCDFTPEQLAQLMSLLQSVNVAGQNKEPTADDFAGFSGPFNESPFEDW